MYIKLNKSKIEFKECKGFINRFKGFKFYFEPITVGLRYNNKRSLNTYFVCQRLDIIMTNKKNEIIKIYRSFKTEKLILPKFKVYYTYLLPNKSIPDDVNVGDVLSIISK